MALMQRRKGQAGEREVAGIIRDLTGWDARRRVRQHDGDSDLLGVPGWSIEVKRHKAATRSILASWWDQTVAQADHLLPLLLYRLDRQDWRAVWPLAIQWREQKADYWTGYEWTADSSLPAWAAVARELQFATEPMREAA